MLRFYYSKRNVSKYLRTWRNYFSTNLDETIYPDSLTSSIFLWSATYLVLVVILLISEGSLMLFWWTKIVVKKICTRSSCLGVWNHHHQLSYTKSNKAYTYVVSALKRAEQQIDGKPHITDTTRLICAKIKPMRNIDISITFDRRSISGSDGNAALWRHRRLSARNSDVIRRVMAYWSVMLVNCNSGFRVTVYWLTGG